MIFEPKKTWGKTTKKYDSGGGRPIQGFCRKNACVKKSAERECHAIGTIGAARLFIFVNKVECIVWPEYRREVLGKPWQTQSAIDDDGDDYEDGFDDFGVIQRAIHFHTK